MSNRIEIWRTEVSLAQSYCVCSKPTIATAANQVTSKDALPTSTSSTAIESDNHPESTQQSTDISGPSHQPAEPANPYDHRGAMQTSLALKLGCPVCSARIDESVSFQLLRRQGERGLVRGRASPRSVMNIDNLKETSSYDKYKPPATTRFKRAVAKPFKNLRKASSFEYEKYSARGENKTMEMGKAVLRPLMKLFGGSSKWTLSSDVGPDGARIRPRATEMYHAYREETGTSAGSVETLLSALSDDNERRRPGLTIDESAARLRRAQKLLERNG
ncbi:hypothetical protein M434DRAFT_396688 [Hypoxylon sp. CO27-5]|nr:hypothetical protein M434DRAFT_396688 [Hypoxylon sp. CO27-5]